MTRHHPEAFANIKQATKKGKSLAERHRRSGTSRKEARTVAASHLASYTRLRRTGRLQNPQPKRVFSHQAGLQRRKRNCGARQGSREISEKIRAASHLLLAYRARPSRTGPSRNKRPDAFAHIAQRREFQDRQDRHVQDARRLVKRHGKLPGARWLQTHGYGRLYAATLKYPERFGALPRKKKRRRTPQERLAEAEKLVRQHGKLPTPYWLQTHGHWNLYAAMRSHPNCLRT